MRKSLTINLKDARVVSLSVYPGKEGINHVLLFAATLTHVNADKLGILKGCFREEPAKKKGGASAWIPHNYDGYPKPHLRIDGADAELGNNRFRATLVHKFTVKQPRSGGDNDITLELSFRMHFAADEVVYDWLKTQGMAPFPMSIGARQEDLNFGGEDPEGESEEDPDTGCVACNNDIPMGLAGKHITGQNCTRVTVQ